MAGGGEGVPDRGTPLTPDRGLYSRAGLVRRGSPLSLRLHLAEWRVAPVRRGAGLLTLLPRLQASCVRGRPVGCRDPWATCIGAPQRSPAPGTRSAVGHMYVHASPGSVLSPWVTCVCAFPRELAQLWTTCVCAPPPGTRLAVGHVRVCASPGNMLGPRAGRAAQG